MRTISSLLAALLVTVPLPAQLFQGIEPSGNPIRSTTLAGFPAVAYASHALFEVNGMTAMGDGSTLLIAKGPFTTNIYRSVLGGTPQLVIRSGIDLHGLAWGRDTLFGFSNYGTPKGIYAVDLSTGAATPVYDPYTVASSRYFALDYNPVDDYLYGYTEYGVSGLYAIDIDNKAQFRVAPPIPAANTQGRGLAVGGHMVYLTATRGLDGISCYALDLSLGAAATWVPFTNPYPSSNATGGSAFLEVRQAWLGHRGPGRVTLSCCGQELRSGGVSDFRIHGGQAGAPGFLLLSTSANPTFVPALGATIVPYPPNALAPIAVDGRGWLRVPLVGGGGPISLVVQVLLRDPTIATGFAVSNAIRLDLLP